SQRRNHVRLPRDWGADPRAARSGPGGNRRGRLRNSGAGAVLHVVPVVVSDAPSRGARPDANGPAVPETPHWTARRDSRSGIRNVGGRISMMWLFEWTSPR